MPTPAGNPSTDRAAPPRDGDTRFLDPQVLARISNIELIARGIVQGFLIGLHRSPYHGFSSEFSAYRKYAKGDSFKFIDWKVVARSDRVYIKQFEENTNTRCHILLDCSASMSFGGADANPGGGPGGESRGIQKWLYARNLAAALAHLMIRQGDAAGLALFNDRTADVLGARSSSVHLQQLLKALAAAAPKAGTDTKAGLAGLPERFPQRGLLVLISDLLDDAERIVGILRDFSFRRHEIVVFQILAPEEIQFPYRENMDFIDAETGTVVAAQGSYIADAYQQAFSDHTAKVKGFCRQNNIDFLQLNTGELLSRALLAYLNKRQRMG